MTMRIADVNPLKANASQAVRPGGRSIRVCVSACGAARTLGVILGFEILLPSWDAALAAPPGDSTPADRGPAGVSAAIPAGPWYLRLRVVDPDGNPVSGVQVWRGVGGAGQRMVQSLPIAWAEIEACGKGTAKAGCVNWKTPDSSTSDTNGMLLQGPFRVNRGCDFTLYHPSFAAVTIHTNAAALKRDALGVVDLGSITLSPGHSIQGNVRDSEGAPVSNAWVAAQPSADPDFPRRQEHSVGSFGFRIGHIRTTRTDSAGKYVLTGLEAYDYRVAAWNADFPPACATVELWRTGAGESRAENQDFILKQATGSVTEVSVTTQDIEEGERPLTSAAVRVVGSGTAIGTPGFGGLTWFRGKTGADGAVKIRNLPETEKLDVWQRKCEIWVEDGRGNRWCSGSVPPGGKHAARFVYGNLNVRVEGADRPLDGCFCDLACVDTGRLDPSSWARGIHPDKSPDGARFDSPTGPWFDGGRVSCTGLVCGTWRLVLWAPGYEKLLLERALTEKGIEETVRLPPGRVMLTGTVRDQTTHEPIEDATILVTAMNPPRPGWTVDWTPARCLRAATAGNGSFRLQCMPEANQMVEVRVESPRYVPVEYELRTQSSTYTEDRDLQRAGWLAARFVQGGAAVTGEVGSVWEKNPPAKGGFRGKVIARADGTWTSGPLLPGAYLLRAGETNCVATAMAGNTVDLGTIDIVSREE